METIKTVFLLRGVPGAGKSTVAAKIVGDGVICQTDDFISGESDQDFDQAKWDKARFECRKFFLNCLRRGCTPIIVSNTNTTFDEINFFKKAAEFENYTVHILVVEKYHESVSDHCKSADRIEKYRENLSNNIKLL